MPNGEMDKAPEVLPVLRDQFETDYVRPAPGRTVVVGSRRYKTSGPDRRAMYSPPAIGIDLQDGDGVDVVWDLLQGTPPGIGHFAHCDALSVLEHTPDPQRLAENIQHLLALGGTLFISVPLVWRVHAYPDDYHRFTIPAVKELFPYIKWSHICYAHRELTENTKIPQIIYEGHVYLCRTEVYGFGVKGWL